MNWIYKEPDAMEKLPTWDMSTLYGDVDTPLFLGDLDRMVSLSKELERQLLNPEYGLVPALDAYQKILDINETLDAFANSLRTTDTTNAKYAKAVTQVGEASLEVEKVDVLFLSFLVSHKEEIHTLTAKGQELEAYKFVLEEALERQKHTLPNEMEALAAELSRCGTDAFSRLQEAVSAGASVTWCDGQKKTATELRSYAFSSDRVLRKLAFDKELEIWKEHEEAFSASLNGVKGATIALDKARGYESPLARSLFQSRIDQTTFEALLGTLEKNLPLFRSYLATKAKALGLEELAFYDLFAPVGKGNRSYTYEQAKQFIIQRMGSFSPKVGAFVTKAFAQNWIDPEAHPGKIGGAYDTAFPLFGQSRVLSNFDYSYNGVSTLAHELGHAFHDSVVLPLPHMLRSYPMTLAETASIFSEFIAFKGALSLADASEKVTLEEHFIQDACQVCVDILCRFYFEQEVFEKRKSEELTADGFCSLMVDCQKRTYGGLSEYHPYMWAVKCHYYSSDFSFYNYPYAFGQLFGLGLYAQYQKDPAGFEDKYVMMLSKTGSASSMDVAASIGCDIRTPSFWQAGMDIIGSYIRSFAHDCTL